MRLRFETKASKKFLLFCLYFLLDGSIKTRKNTDKQRHPRHQDHRKIQTVKANLDFAYTTNER